jgi:hypothetical protein
MARRKETMDHRIARTPSARPWLGLIVILLLLSGHATAQQPTAFSAHFMAAAIATTGWYTLEECPTSTVAERSQPGCARIPAPLETAVQWLDRIEDVVFQETEREGEWQSERGLKYAIWRLVVTGQRYLLVLAPHPSLSVTILYVSELPAP